MSVLKKISEGLISFGSGIPQSEIDTIRANRDLAQNQAEIAGNQITTTSNQARISGVQADQAEREEARQTDPRIAELERQVAMGNQNAAVELSGIDPKRAQFMLETSGLQTEQQQQSALQFANEMLSTNDPAIQDELIKKRIPLLLDPTHTQSLLDMSPADRQLSLESMRNAILNFGIGATAGQREFESLTQGMSPEDIENAKRIKLGLDPRAVGAANKITDVGGVPTVVNPQTIQQTPLSTLPGEADAAEELAAGAEAGKSGGLNLTPGQLKVDQAFADDFVAWQAGGGFADVQKNVDQIGSVVVELEEAQKEGATKNLTGFSVGNVPRAVLATTNPEALDALERVEEVVQRNLRLILGAQFTEREGERLIARAYNPRLEEAQNAKRLNRLQKSLTDAAKAKQDAANYFAEKGTLAGFDGSTPTITSIMNDFENTETAEDRLTRLRAEVNALEQEDEQ